MRSKYIEWRLQSIKVTPISFTFNKDLSSSEVSISVVGIESVQIAEKSLRPGHSGFVEVKVSA